MPLTTCCWSQWKRWRIFLEKGVIATSSPLVIAPVLLANKDERSICFPVCLTYKARTIVTTALVDCGANGNFIDPILVERLLPSQPIQPFQALNIDSTQNKQGQITTTTQVHCKSTAFEDDLSLMIVGLGRAQIILGMPWLTKKNCWIDWSKRSITFDEEHIWKTTLSTDLAIATDKEEVNLPKSHTDYCTWTSSLTDIWYPSPLMRLQPTIDLKESFIPKVGKIYPLNPQESIVCKEFIKEHLKTGHIHPSKSPQASPFFFVKKKDGKLQPIQDHRYVNDHMVKDTYSLPLISDLVDNLWQFSLFTKFDIRWSYNNIHIKDGDEWKVAFITPLGLFEPTVMFFRLCGSPPMFQVFMNHNFADYIWEGWLVILPLPCHDSLSWTELEIKICWSISLIFPLWLAMTSSLGQSPRYRLPIYISNVTSFGRKSLLTILLFTVLLLFWTFHLW